MSINDILAERERTHGSFKTHAAITQALKHEMVRTPRWVELSDSQKESLEMIAHKIGRILAGNPDYIEHWRDCIGYLQLVVDELMVKEGATDGKIQKLIVKNRVLTRIE